MKFAVICCDSKKPLALLDVRFSQSGSVTMQVEPMANPAHMRLVVNPVVDGKPTFSSDELAKQTHEDATERSVTEIDWGDHRSWVIRCDPACPTRQEAMITEKNLPRIAEKLAAGNWEEKIADMPVVPLGVLSYLTDPHHR